MTSEDAIKIIKAGGWGYPECDITAANLMAIDALEKIEAVEQFIVYLNQGLPIDNPDERFKGMRQVIDWLSPILWPEVEE